MPDNRTKEQIISDALDGVKGYDSPESKAALEAIIAGMREHMKRPLFSWREIIKPIEESKDVRGRNNLSGAATEG